MFFLRIVVSAGNGKDMMDMIQAIQGHFCDDWRFVPDVKMGKAPTNKRIIVNVLDTISNSTAQQRLDALDKIFAEAKKAEGELSDEEWKEFENLRSESNFSRAVDL